MQKNEGAVIETWEEEVLRLLNDGEYGEALKMFRQKHDMVNRFRCSDCGFTSSKITNFTCENCSVHNIKVVVVQE